MWCDVYGRGRRPRGRRRRRRRRSRRRRRRWRRRRREGGYAGEGSVTSVSVAALQCNFPGSPLLSMRLAMFTEVCVCVSASSRFLTISVSPSSALCHSIKALFTGHFGHVYLCLRRGNTEASWFPLHLCAQDPSAFRCVSAGIDA